MAASNRGGKPADVVVNVGTGEADTVELLDPITRVKLFLRAVGLLPYRRLAQSCLHSDGGIYVDESRTGQAYLWKLTVLVDDAGKAGHFAVCAHLGMGAEALRAAQHVSQIHQTYPGQREGPAPGVCGDGP